MSTILFFVLLLLHQHQLETYAAAAKKSRQRQQSPSRDLFEAFSKAFEDVYMRKRMPGSLGLPNDLPVSILTGKAETYRPVIDNPLVKSHRTKLTPSKLDEYKKAVSKDPKTGPPEIMSRSASRKPCGHPICTTVDQSVRSFDSLCDFVAWANENSKYRQIFEIQSGNCETLIWGNKRALVKNARRGWGKGENKCSYCDGLEYCKGMPICVNDDGHAKTFDNVCEAVTYLHLRRAGMRKRKVVAISLGDCKSLFSNCQHTEWFDLDDPSDETERESVKSVFNYLTGLSRKNVHRSCPMNYIHYPVEFRTLEGQAKTAEKYDKSPHQFTCVNAENEDELKVPYAWNIPGSEKNMTCRDWKIRYCCENMWGTPASFAVLSKKANFKVVGRPITETDVFVDMPLKRELFEDCRWGGFLSNPTYGKSDINTITSHSRSKRNVCNLEKSQTLYIDARTVDGEMTPWYQTGFFLNKVSPFFGVYCDGRNNNNKACPDYKFRLCCSKTKMATSPWGKWSQCQGECNSENFQVRTRKCRGKRKQCDQIALEDKMPCHKPCQAGSQATESTWMPWSTCSVSCGQGEIIRWKRTCNSKEQKCEKSQDVERKACTATACKEYALSIWSEWSECSGTCSPALKTRTRTCQDTVSGSIVAKSLCQTDKTVNPLSNSVPCTPEPKPCPVDGGYSAWSEWTTCRCGSRTKRRTRECAFPKPAGTGKDCKSLGKAKEEAPCEEIKNCPPSCDVSEWGEWGPCSLTCVPLGTDKTSASRTRFRHVTTKGLENLKGCPPLEDSEACTFCSKEKDDKQTNCIKECPIDCQLSPWEPWNLAGCECSNKAKLTGVKDRYRTVKQFPNALGQKCKDENGKEVFGTVSEEEPCSGAEQKERCTDTNAAHGPWGEWKDCVDRSFGGTRKFNDGAKQKGTRLRRRHCYIEPCKRQDLVETEECTPKVLLTKDDFWGAWSSCSVTCGVGKFKRTKVVGNGGKQDEQIEKCDLGPCGSSSEGMMVTEAPPEETYEVNSPHGELMPPTEEESSVEEEADVEAAEDSNEDETGEEDEIIEEEENIEEGEKEEPENEEEETESDNEYVEY